MHALCSSSFSALPSYRNFGLSTKDGCRGIKRRRSIRIAAFCIENDRNYDCVVVGGGISGLSTAHALGDSHKVLLTESTDRVGGNIISVEKDGYLWEEGPNSFQPSPSILNLLVDCGLKDELVLGDPKAPRFVFWEGKLRPVPSSPFDVLSFDLMSFGGKLRAAFGAIGMRSPPPDKEETVEEFVRRNLGSECFERLIEPFCSGVYAGDPSKLSMKAAFGRVWRLENIGGSIIGGALKTIQERSKAPKQSSNLEVQIPKGQTVGSFRKGLSMMANAIASGLGSKVKLQWKLMALTKLSEGGYSLTYETPDGFVAIQTKTVALNIPSYVASNILRPLSETTAEALLQLYYPPVVAVTLSYPKSAIRTECLIDGELKGFGQLHPRGQGIETLGTLYSSSLFPGRAPPDKVLLLNYIGGATNPEVMSKNDSNIIDTVNKDLRKMLIRPDASDPIVLAIRKWSHAIPQFMVGHLDLLDTARDSLYKSGMEGLFLGGNYVSGVALGRCVEGAYELAKEINKFLTRH